MTLEDQLKAVKRGTIDVISEEELIAKLKEDRPLNVKFGIDPTAPDIHLGHTVPLQKLRQFQDAGHIIHLIIGDYTAMIGDPSGRSETRPILTREQIVHNLQTYTTQVYKVLDQSRTNLFFNSDWLGKFSGEEMIRLASKFTVQQLLQRRDFANRMEQNKPLSVSELMYPLLVGYDSVHLQTDIELGGSDQLFNFMASRSMQTVYGQKAEVVLILPLLEGIDGEKKMSKSLGNAIGVTDAPGNMYGKIMSISDPLMLKFYELLSEVSVEELAHIKEVVSGGAENPMTYKKKLANELVARYHGNDLMTIAQREFERVHQRRDVPDNIEAFEVKYSGQSDLGLIGIVRAAAPDKVKSNGEARRLIEQHGIKINGAAVSDSNYILTPQDGTVLQVGKRYFKSLQFKKI